MNKATLAYTYWQDENMWLGHLDDYPDYLTQAMSLDELKENLFDIYNELMSGTIPVVRQHGELELA